MKKIIIFLIVLFPAIGFADTWCQWDGVQATDCQSDNKGYIIDTRGFKVSTEPIANENGYYRMVTTEPVIGENQTKDQEIWGFAGNEISRTWTVRDLTITEIDENTASPMPLSEYYLWKALLVKGVITQQEAANTLPQELIDAYLARDRLENP
jgi:hypothetical protein